MVHVGMHVTEGYWVGRAGRWDSSFVFFFYEEIKSEVEIQNLYLKQTSSNKVL